MFKKIISSILILSILAILPFQSVMGFEDHSFIEKSFDRKNKIEVDGKIYTLEKTLDSLYLIKDTEKIRLATFKIEGITDRKITTMLRTTYSWTSPIEQKYSISLENNTIALKLSANVITSIILSPLTGLGTIVLANLVAGYISDKAIEYLTQNKPSHIYVTVRYKEQLGCSFRKFYIDIKFYLDSRRTNLWNNIPLNQEIFEGNRNDFTLPAACRLG